MENVKQKYCPFCKDSTLDIILDENTGELHLYALQEINSKNNNYIVKQGIPVFTQICSKCGYVSLTIADKSLLKNK